MIEEIPPRKSENVISPAQRAEAYLESQQVSAWGGGVSGDFINVVVGMSMRCAVEPMWAKIQPVRTIEQYVKDKMMGTGAIDASVAATAVIERINPEFLEKANRMIAEMNSIILNGVTSQQQVDMLLEKFNAFSNLLYKRES